MLRHKRVSGNPNESPDKLGGENWDEPHVYPIGSLFLYGIGDVMYDSGNRQALNMHGGIVDMAYNFTYGYMTIQINIAALPIPPDATVAPVVISSGARFPSTSHGFVFDEYDPLTGNIILYSVDPSLYGLILGDFWTMFQVYLKVIAP